LRIITSQEFKGKMLDQVVNRGKADLSSTLSLVRKVIMDVKENGDEALLRYSRKFDNVQLVKLRLRVSKKEIEESYGKLETDQIDALKESAVNITRFHESQVRDAWSMEIMKGVTVGQMNRSLASVGVYAPGGKASYPSSILMCVIPAKVVGVKEIMVCSPPREDGAINPSLLVAADIAGASEIYRVGGAQAIAAMAYGTETVPKVDKIVGPGNVFVTTAKMEVSKDVAVDFPAGPSEVLIIADETANVSFVASDLLAQAEHDPRALAILFTTSENLAHAVEEEVFKQLESLSRKETAKFAIKTGALIVLFKNIEHAVECANLIAPEHLQILTKTPHQVFNKIQNAGAIFLGQYSPVAFGDYSAGLNHVLPTGGYAKTCSGLSTRDFMKTINFIECNKNGYLSLKRTTLTLAELEGFNGHARSVSMRGAESEN
jgi:histidinol dehydrogenase